MRRHRLQIKSSIPNKREIGIEIKSVSYTEKIFENDIKILEFDGVKFACRVVVT